MTDVLKMQYEAVRGSRDELLRYCSSISPQHFIQPIEYVGHSSIRNLLVHVANASLYWLSEFALKDEPNYGKPGTITSMDQVSALFKDVDIAMDKFMAAFPDNKPFTGWVKWVKKDVTTTPLELYTHVVTHLFHHKGQILSMSRQLGYTPMDTDVIRF